MSDSRETPLEGLFMRFVKTIADERGFLAELSKESSQDVFLEKGVENIVAVVAANKGIARGGHYHKTSYENHWTLSGTGIWYFYDLNPSSKTYQRSLAFLAGDKHIDIPQELGIPDYTLQTKGSILQTMVSPYIYHLVIPLSVPLTFFEIASTTYDESDYVRITPNDIKDELLQKITNLFIVK